VAGSVSRRFLLLALAAGLAGAGGQPAPDRFDTVVVDAGHGGEDEGARGPSGLYEKDLVLDLARRLTARLAKLGLNVVQTRPDDRFVPLESRMSLANDARADLFVSIHANASPSAGARGVETYFLSPEASDDAAREVAQRENAAFGAGAARPIADRDPLVAILGDMMATEHLAESDEFARFAQAELVALDASPARGVKQAPFVVLMGLQMPAALVEVGFITNPREERGLREARRRAEIVEALARAVVAFGRRHDARRGVAPERSLVGGGG
jgi:N-acetylmuramoyl-L-alanine amidase